MLVIRKEQMEVFEESAIQAFADRTYVHLLEYFPRHCELLGEAQMRQVIQHGWEKAKSYQLLEERCVRSYIDLMCVLGGEFDTDPLLPWAAEILQDRAAAEVARGDQLYEKAWNYIEHIKSDYRDDTGKASMARFVGELRHIQQSRDKLLTPAIWPAFAEALEARFYAAFPAKCAYIGAARIAQAITHGADQARQYEITCERGVMLISALRFVLGGGFDKDLLLPWAASTLNDKTIADQHERTDRLFEASSSFLNYWRESIPGLEN